jgi:hypothetical protein
MSSWFHIGIEVKNAWDSHNLVKDALTGTLLGNLLVERGLKKWPAYLKIRDGIAVHVSSKLMTRSDLASREISLKILENTLDKSHISKVSSALKQKVANMTCRDFFACSSFGFTALKKVAAGYFFNSSQPALPADLAISAQAEASSSSIRGVARYVYQNYSNQKAHALLQLLASGEYAEFTQNILHSSLQPVCETAVKASLSSLTKLAVSNGIDSGAKAAVSILVPPLFYKAMISLVLAVQHRFEASRVYFPKEDPTSSLSSMLALSTLIHFSLIASAILRRRMSPMQANVDKSQIQQLVLHFSKDPIQRKLKDNQLFKCLENELDQATIDAFVTNMLNGVVEFYWQDFAGKKLLGIPLVL